MDNISSELKRINGTLLIMMIIILLGSCAGGEVTVDYPEDVNDMETEKMVHLGDGYFSIYTGFEMKIYHYDKENNELSLKNMKYMDEE